MTPNERLRDFFLEGARIMKAKGNPRAELMIAAAEDCKNHPAANCQAILDTVKNDAIEALFDGFDGKVH